MKYVTELHMYVPDSEITELSSESSWSTSIICLSGCRGISLLSDAKDGSLIMLSSVLAVLSIGSQVTPSSVVAVLSAGFKG